MTLYFELSQIRLKETINVFKVLVRTQQYTGIDFSVGLVETGFNPTWTFLEPLALGLGG